jgi:hypothetical protein
MVVAILELFCSIVAAILELFCSMVAAILELEQQQQL